MYVMHSKLTTICTCFISSVKNAKIPKILGKFCRRFQQCQTLCSLRKTIRCLSRHPWFQKDRDKSYTINVFLYIVNMQGFLSSSYTKMIIFLAPILNFVLFHCQLCVNGFVKKFGGAIYGGRLFRLRGTKKNF